MRCPAVLLAAAAARGASAETVTMYDVLAEDCRDDLALKNYGDPAGDAYFNVKDIYLPVACAKCRNNPRGCQMGDPAYVDCSNPESKKDRRERVVRKVEIEHSGAYGQYARCNVAVDSCAYTCIPPGFGGGLGRQEVRAGTGSLIAPTPRQMQVGSDAADYWNYNTANTLGGYWYSSAQSTTGKVVKAINAACQSRWLYKQVQVAGAACFNACPNATDQTSECWVGCFFETTLGKGSDRSTRPTGGMGKDAITKLWLAGFESDDPSVGGCPPCPATGPCPDSTQPVGPPAPPTPPTPPTPSPPTPPTPPSPGTLSQACLAQLQSTCGSVVGVQRCNACVGDNAFDLQKVCPRPFENPLPFQRWCAGK